MNKKKRFQTKLNTFVVNKFRRNFFVKKILYKSIFCINKLDIKIMNKLTLNVKFENCYGIRKLLHEFKFCRSERAYSIYAPNGTMKTSFAKTFGDFLNKKETNDLVNPSLITKREIYGNVEIKPQNIFVIESYNENYKSEQISTLLVNEPLKNEFDAIHNTINNEKKSLVKELKKTLTLRNKNNNCIIEQKILECFNENFLDFLLNNKRSIEDEIYIKYSEVQYSTIFNPKVIAFLNNPEIRDAITDYINTYKNLTKQSPYLKKEFQYHNAENTHKQLKDNNFFDAGHTINLFNGTEKLECTSEGDFKQLIELEKKKILDSKELQQKFRIINKRLSNRELRSFRDYLLENKEILLELQDLSSFERKVWFAYLTKFKDLSLNLIDRYNKGKDDIQQIIKRAKSEQTEWENVIENFNERFFHLPFRLAIKNKDDVILKEAVPTIDFIFKSTTNNIQIEYKKLLRILSTGEKRALYILNIMFEVQARKNTNDFTLFIIDDIADSFDYKNKYAIIEYLKDMSKRDNFFMLILTHNFDFYRTIQSRSIVKYKKCLTVVKKKNELELAAMEGVKNPFINDWKGNLHENKKLIASIPFVRNLIEYTKSSKDKDYLLLTSVLHRKDNSLEITKRQISEIFERHINVPPLTTDLDRAIFDIIFETSDNCLNENLCVNLENKIVLSIGIRLEAEKFMFSKITDTIFLRELESKENQTWKLIKKYATDFNKEIDIIKILKRVNLMTPINIHINSFMYEPILDMGEEELKELYSQVKNLATFEVKSINSNINTSVTA